MKQLLLLSLALFIFGAANAQSFPVNGADNTWTSQVTNGRWDDAATWQQPEGWNGSCNYPGCVGTIDGQPIDWVALNPSIIIKQTHTVEVWTTISLRAFVKVEGATYDNAGNELIAGGNLYFVKNQNDKGRLDFLYESFVLLEKGSDIQAITTNGTAADNSADYIQFHGPAPDNQIYRLMGKEINEVETPALLWWGMPESCGEVGGDCSPPVQLPVDLLSYTASVQQSEVTVEWVAAKEINFSHYVVEWSVDAKTFYAAGSIVAKGTENGVQRYSFRHQPGQSGTLYYRLLAVDIDGTVEDKGIKAVRVGGEVFAAYTKAGRLHINYNGPEASKVSVLDLSGRMVLNAKLDAAGIETVSLRAGVYLVQVSNSLEQKTQRVIIH
jgi:hypothetical protein